MRFDAAGLAYLLLVALVGSCAAGALRKGRGHERWWVTVTLAVVSGLAVADVHFFGEFGTHLNFVALEYMDAPWVALGMIAQDLGAAGVAANLALIAAAAVALDAAVRRLFRPHAEQGVELRRLGFGRAALLVALVVAARGGLGRPLRPQDAGLSGDRFVNQLALSGPFTIERHLYEAWRDRDEDPGYGIDPEEAARTVRGMLDRGETFLDPESPALRRPPQRERGPRRSVVVVVMESFAGRFVGALGAEGPTLTPQFDALAAQGHLFTRFYATGPSTNRSLAALLAGFPCVAKRTAITKSSEGQQEFLTLARILGREGYGSAFCSAGLSSWENLGGWCRGQGFDRTVDSADFDDAQALSVWGVPDHVLLDRVLVECEEMARGGPFAAVVLTGSNHPPFSVPDPLPDAIPVEPVPPIPLERVRAVRYADWALGRFVRSVRESAWGKDTLLVLVGDHGVHVAPQADIDPDRRHVPLLLLDPVRREPARDPRIASHVDVLPTVLALLGVDSPHAAWGRDLLTPTPDAQGAAAALRGECAVLGPHGGERVYGVAAPADLFYVERIGGRGELYRRGPDGRTLTVIDAPADAAILRLVGRSYLQQAHETLVRHRAGR